MYGHINAFCFERCLLRNYIFLNTWILHSFDSHYLHGVISSVMSGSKLNSLRSSVILLLSVYGNAAFKAPQSPRLFVHKQSRWWCRHLGERLISRRLALRRRAITLPVRLWAFIPQYRNTRHGRTEGSSHLCGCSSSRRHFAYLSHRSVVRYFPF